MESHAWFSLFSYYFVLLFYYDRILFGKALIDTTLYLVIYQGLIFFVLFFLRTSEINLFWKDYLQRNSVSDGYFSILYNLNKGNVGR